jgi:diguanylate cyclase (GGDEF)-like protein
MIMGDASVLKKFKYFSERDLNHSFDPLTKVLNRETMEGYIRHLVSAGTPFSLFILDVDNFKNVNDTYGHFVGDIVLTKTAAYICDKVGDLGAVGRYGGDEFMIVFEGLSEYKDVWAVGHNINIDINELVFDGVPSLHVTITMGVSRYPLNSDSYEGLLRVADKALYRGKMKGRNCFIIYLDEKHKNIDIRRDKGNNYSSMYLCSRVFVYLTQSDNLQNNISYLFKRIVGYYMFDHVCIETPTKINFQTVHSLARVKEYQHIDNKEIDHTLNNLGLVNIGRTDTVDEKVYGSFISSIKKQGITSTVCCKIEAYGKEYGFIRVDMSSTARMWQSSEMDVILIAAHTLGLLLHYQNKTLDDFDDLPVQIVDTNWNLD